MLSQISKSWTARMPHIFFGLGISQHCIPCSDEVDFVDSDWDSLRRLLLAHMVEAEEMKQDSHHSEVSSEKNLCLQTYDILRPVWFQYHVARENLFVRKQSQSHSLLSRFMVNPWEGCMNSFD